MSKKITAIKRDIVHQICAGQVVLNLATAVKELIENSLDAGATSIEIRLKEYGSELIQVSDNGKGILPDDFEALALKHHTSKIRDFSDLVDVETFGFRGEALSSLCAVSELIVKTRHESENCGSMLTFDRTGVLQKIQPFPRQVGTTITLTNLFSSLPVRQREFLRNLKKEFTKTTQLLSAYCLIATNVKITCVNQTKKGGRVTFLSTQENKTVRENISCVFGPKQLATLLEISDVAASEQSLQQFGVSDSNYSAAECFNLEGFVSSCEHGCGRSSCDRQFYYINSRPCDPARIIKLTNEVYHRYNQHQFPFVLFNLVVPKESVDVNVTPDKRIIFLENEKLLLARIQSSLVKTFENIPSTYKIRTPVSLSVTGEVGGSENQKIRDSEGMFLKLNKWRHRNDSGYGQQITAVSLKRGPSTEQSQRSSDYKQIKLDQLFETKAEDGRGGGSTTTLHSISVLPCKTSNSPPVSRKHNDLNYTYAADPCDQWNGIPAISEQVVVDSDFERRGRKESETARTNEKTQFNSASCSLSVAAVLKREPTLDLPTACSRDFSLNNKLQESDDDQRPQITSTRNEEATVSAVLALAEFSDCVSTEQTVYDSTAPIRTHETRKIVATIVTNISCLRESLRKGSERKNKAASIANKFHAEIDPTTNRVAEEELKREISKHMFVKMKIVGQFNLGFIITKLENDLFIVDQHATDEKYNFESLQRTTSLKNQKLVVPRNLNLTATNECILMDNIDVLRKNGFEFSIDTNAEPTKRVKLTSIPVSRNWQFGKDDVDEMLFMLQDAPNTLCRPSRIRAMFASRACRKSVMIGIPLSTTEMRKLINNMGVIEQPWVNVYDRRWSFHVHRVVT